MVSDDLLAPDVIADPHPYFRRLAEDDPVHWNERWGGWIVTRYEDVARALQDACLSADPFTPLKERLSEAERERWSTIFRILARGMVYRDPPEHTRERALVSKAFTRGALERVRPRIQPLVDELLDRMEGRGDVDLIRDFAYPLPAAVIADFIGVPEFDADRIKAWSNDIAALMLGAVQTPDRHDCASKALEEMTEYFRGIVRERRRAPRDDYASALVAAHQDEPVGEDELAGMCALVVFAAHETTTNLIANGMLVLLQHDEERERLRRAVASDQPADAGLLASAVEELLRFDGPMKAISRVAKAPLELYGRRIEAGHRLLLVLASANRDPARFVEPDRLDLGRRDNPHMAFGYGIHYCLGAPLARLEAQAAVASLLRRMPSMRLAVPYQTLKWQAALLIRGVSAMPVALG